MLKSICSKASLALLATLAISGTVLAVGPGGTGGGVGKVPEINPGMLGSAASLLVGGALLIRDRFRRS